MTAVSWNDVGQCDICEAVLLGPSDVHMDWHRNNDATAPVDLQRTHETYYIGLGNDPGNDMRWFTDRGYTVIGAAGLPSGTDTGFGFGSVGMGIVFSRGNEPAKVAGIGTTLVWDGESIRVWTS